MSGPTNWIDGLRAPLLVSWQITRDCDLCCLHCCTESAPGKGLPDELDAQLLVWWMHGRVDTSGLAGERPYPNNANSAVPPRADITILNYEIVAADELRADPDHVGGAAHTSGEDIGDAKLGGILLERNGNRVVAGFGVNLITVSPGAYAARLARKSGIRTGCRPRGRLRPAL